MIAQDSNGSPIYAEAKNEAPVVSVNSVPDFPRWSTEALQDYTEKNGIVAPRGWKHTELAEACRKHAEAAITKRLAAERPEQKPEPVRVDFKEPEPKPKPKPKAKKKGKGK